MKRFFITCAIIVFGAMTFAAEDTVLQGGVTFDWLTITQEQRDNAVKYFKDILFEAVPPHGRSFEINTKYADFQKDKDYKKHYRLAAEGFTETDKYNICAFAMKNGVLLIYAIQYKDNLKNTYYYDAFGNLRYLDETSDNYPNFPYYTLQYRRSNGNLISAIYVESKDVQYIFEPDGKFKGVWYKDKMYDQNSKQILTRTNW